MRLKAAKQNLPSESVQYSKHYINYAEREQEKPLLLKLTLSKVTFHTHEPLSSAEASLCCGEAGENEKLLSYRDTQREPLRRREITSSISPCHVLLFVFGLSTLLIQTGLITNCARN